MDSKCIFSKILIDEVIAQIRDKGLSGFQSPSAF